MIFANICLLNIIIKNIFLRKYGFIYQYKENVGIT